MTSAQPQFEERAGHHWQEADRVADYIASMDSQEAERTAVFSLMTKIFTDEPDAPISILDVGSGYGPVATVCLDAYPNATAIGLDISDAMMQVGNERMARFGDRFGYMVGDFADGVLPSVAIDSGPYDLIVSARAIHHLSAESTETMYASIFKSLKPGGAFFNTDTASPETAELHESFRRVSRSERPSYRPNPTPADRAHQNMAHHRDATLVKHLEWLKAAGFTSVDCYWKRLGLALLGGFKA